MRMMNLIPGIAVIAASLVGYVAKADMPVVADRCQPAMATVEQTGRSFDLKYDQQLFNQEYQQLVKETPRGARVPSVEQVQADIQEIVKSKMSHIFPSGNGPADLTITISCNFSPRINCKITIEL